MPAQVMALCLLAQVTVEAGGRIEARAGQAPFSGTADRSPRPQVASVVLPAAALGLSAAATSGRVRYAPRLVWRHPNEAERVAPLVLHAIDVQVEHEMSGASSWLARADGSLGEIEFAALPQILGSNQGSLPEVAEVIEGEAGVALRQRWSERWRSETAVSIAHMRPRHGPATAAPMSPGEPAPVTFPTQTTLILTPALTGGMSVRDELVVSSSIGAYHAPTHDIAVLAWMPEVAWRRKLAREQVVRVGLGAVYAPRLDRALAPPSSETLSPIGSVGLDATLHRSRAAMLTAATVASVAWHLDPVLGRTGQRGNVGLRLSLAVPARWTIGIEGTFSTSLARHPFAGAPDETIAWAALPVAYRWAPEGFLEMGLRWTDQAPHLRAEDWSFRRREIWVYAQIGTSWSDRPWAARSR